MNNHDLKIVQDQLIEDIEIQKHETISSEELFKAIVYRVEYLLEKDPSLLFSYLYRLDIEESQLKLALRGDGIKNGIVLISELIMERQLKRVETKKKYQQKPIDGWNW